jgi:DNA modification methylase
VCTQKYSGITKTNVEWLVYQGSACDILKNLPDNSFNCVVTSPPYFWLRDYDVNGQLGQERTVEDYVDSLCTVMDEIFRVLRTDGVLFLNLGDTYYSGKGESKGVDKKSKKRRFGLRAVDKSGGLGIGIKPKSLIGIPWRVALEMLSRGWILRSSIIWYGKQALREAAKDRPSRSYENVFMFVKSRRYFFDRSTIDNEDEADMWTILARPRASKGVDTAPFPDELVKRCLDIGCPVNGRVLDPFAGSGTTLRVALSTGRSATGIDLNPDFCKYMIEELQKL